MKKIVTTTSLLIAVIFTVNAQRWDRGNDRRDDSRRQEVYTANRVVYHNEGYRKYNRDERRNYDRGNYCREYRREYCHEEPRMVYHRNYYQPRRIEYYYYPSANVYYNPYNRFYIYPCHGEWVNASALPHGLCINEPAREVFCNEDENICAYNSVHLNAYRTYVDVRRCAPIQFRIAIRF